MSISFSGLSHWIGYHSVAQTVGEAMMKEAIIDCFWLLTAVVSVAINFNLANLLLRNPAANSVARCQVRDPTPNRRPVLKTQLDLDGLPHFTGALSHLILEVNEDGQELGRIRRLFAYWQNYPPCLMRSSPSSWTHSQVTLAMVLPRTPATQFAEELKALFEGLPTTVKTCFHSFEIRHAGLAKSPPAERDNSNKTDPATNVTLSNMIRESRALFSSLLSNGVKLDTPNHALYLSPDCVPIQPNWLNLVDYQTRPPNEPYWMMGSIFRGQRKEWIRNIPSFASIGRYAIYNLAASDFRDWYLKRLPKYVEEAQLPQYEFGRWEMDLFHYIADIETSSDFQHVAAKLRYTNVIVNAWNATIDGPAILKMDPDVALVCGIVPDLSSAALK